MTNEVHDKCLMKEEWVKLHENLKSSNDSLVKCLQSQSEINSTQAATLQKLMHRVYGNAEDGILSDIRSNKQTAEGNIKRLEENMKRLWWAFAVIIALMLGNIGLIIKVLGAMGTP